MRIKTIRLTDGEQLRALRQDGWREAGLYQVIPDNKDRLAWFVYPSGLKLINIQDKPT